MLQWFGDLVNSRRPNIRLHVFLIHSLNPTIAEFQRNVASSETFFNILSLGNRSSRPQTVEHSTPKYP